MSIGKGIAIAGMWLATAIAVIGASAGVAGVVALFGFLFATLATAIVSIV